MARRAVARLGTPSRAVNHVRSLRLSPAGIVLANQTGAKLSRRAYRRLAIVCVLLLLPAVGCSGGSQSSTEATSSTAPTRAPSTAPTRVPSSKSQGITYVDPQRYEITYRVTAENAGFSVDRFLLYQPKPVAWDGQSKVQIESVTPDPTHTAADLIGNQIYSWDLSRIPSSGRDQAFVIRFSLTASATHTNLTPGEATPYDRSSNIYANYTAPERYIESDDGQIKKLEERLAAGETDPLTLTRRFYDYIIDNSKYVLTGTGLQVPSHSSRPGKENAVTMQRCLSP